ncbi:MAG: hypothetical protein HFH41_00565 [Lachnospiraceae bacterium]|nr:hypothetical protein [Lachnospiraceae bacterium]
MEIIGMKIIMAVCMLPVLLILYGGFWFSGKEKNGTQYGVTLWPGARDSHGLQEIQKTYIRELNFYAVSCLLIFFLTLLPKRESLVITGQVVWVCWAIFAVLLPFARANKRMKEQKREFIASLPKEEQGEPEDKIFVDVTAAGAKKEKLFRKSMYGAGAFAVLPILAEYVLHTLRPGPQIPDLWACEAVLSSIAVTALLFPCYIHFSAKERTKAVTYNSQINLQIANIRWYQVCKLCMSMTWLMGALNWGILWGLHGPAEWFLPMITALSLASMILSVWLILRCFHQIDKYSKKYLVQEPVLTDGGDEHWIWGLFYYNKNDSRRMVENRVGIGVTVNMAKPGIRYSTILIMVSICLLMFGTSGVAILEEFTPISLSCEEGILIANQWKEVYHIKQEEIHQAMLLEEEPDLVRKAGTGMEVLKKGSFYSNVYERDMEVCLNPKEPPFLMIEMEDGTCYLLGDADGEKTKDILNKIQP